jgi:hypothetical protein
MGDGEAGELGMVDESRAAAGIAETAAGHGAARKPVRDAMPMPSAHERTV